MVRTKHCCLYFPFLALASSSMWSFGKCAKCSGGTSWTPSTRVSDYSDHVRAGGNFGEPCRVPTVSWVEMRGLSSAANGLGRVSMKPKQEEIAFPFVKHSRMLKVGRGYSDMSMQTKDSVFCRPLHFLVAKMNLAGTTSLMDKSC